MEVMVAVQLGTFLKTLIMLTRRGGGLLQSPSPSRDPEEESPTPSPEQLRDPICV